MRVTGIVGQRGVRVFLKGCNEVNHVNAELIIFLAKKGGK